MIQEKHRHTDAGEQSLHPSLLASVNRKKEIVRCLFKDQAKESTQVARERTSMMERHAALCYSEMLLSPPRPQTSSSSS
jgi:hypothetical protein